MKRIVNACLILAAVIPTGLRAEILPGDPKSKVVMELGEPKGAITQGDRDILLYPNGTVEFLNGKASKIDLASPGEIAAREAERAKVKRAAEETRQASIREGENKVREMMATAGFKRMLPAERVYAFERILKRHPGTPMPPEYSAAKTAIATPPVAVVVEQPVSEKEKRLEELQDKKAKLSSSQRRRFSRSHGEEVKALEKELKTP